MCRGRQRKADLGGKKVKKRSEECACTANQPASEPFFIYDRANLMGLNIHSKEPFNQKVEYNVRTEYGMKNKDRKN